MSVAVIPMAAEFGWSNVERGLVSSSFFWGYSLTQTPAGYLATRIGGAKVLLLGVFLWCEPCRALFTFLSIFGCFFPRFYVRLMT